MAQAALSTANNSASNPNLLGGQFSSPAIEVSGVLHAEDIIVVTTKTTYYLNEYIGAGGTTSTLVLHGDYNTTSVKAVCAYL
jgi:hypothetical protein